MPNTPPAYVFIHYYGSAHSRNILDEILSAIKASGMWEHITLIRLIIAGDSLYFPLLRSLISLYPKLHVQINDQWLCGAEVHSLRILHDQSNDLPSDALIAYFHTKGAVNHSRINEDWLTYMIDYNINCWHKSMHCLTSGEYDTYGTSWCYADFSFDPSCTHLHGKRNGHYQGNFWWSTANYIQTLPSPRDCCCRYEAEAWLGLAKPRFYNAMCAPYSLTLASFTRDQYKDYLEHSSQPYTTVQLSNKLIDRIKALRSEYFRHDIDDLTFDENRAGVSWSAKSFDLNNAINSLIASKE